MISPEVHGKLWLQTIFTDQPRSPSRDKLLSDVHAKRCQKKEFMFSADARSRLIKAGTFYLRNLVLKLLFPPHPLVQQCPGSWCCRGQGWVLGLNQSCDGRRAGLCLLLITCRPPQVLSAQPVSSLSRGSRRSDNHVAESTQKPGFCNPNNHFVRIQNARLHSLSRFQPSVPGIKDQRLTRLLRGQTCRS